MDVILIGLIIIVGAYAVFRMVALSIAFFATLVADNFPFIVIICVLLYFLVHRRVRKKDKKE